MTSVVGTVTKIGLTLTLLAWLMIPVAPVVIWSFASDWSFPDLLPRALGLAGWRDADEAGLTAALFRSFVLAAVVSMIATPLGLTMGRLLGWQLTRRPWVLVTVLLVPLVLPPFAVAMGLDVILIRVGVPGMLSVVALLVVVALPYTSYIAAVGYARISPTLAAQARALGATSRQAHWRVTLPALRGPVVASALLAFLVGWSDYVVTLLVGGGQLVTAPVLLGSTAAGAGNDALVAVISLATIAPPVALVLGLTLLRPPGVRSHSDRAPFTVTKLGRGSGR